MFIKYASIILILIFSSGLCLGQDFQFPLIPGPINVTDGLPVTLALNLADNTAGVPCGQYAILRVNMNRNDGSCFIPSTVTIAYDGGQLTKTYFSDPSYCNLAPIFIQYEFQLIPPYEPCTNGGLYITLSQNGTGTGQNFEWSDIQVSLDLLVEGCTNSSASNYNTEANTEDGSCIIPPPPSNNDCFSAIPLTLNARDCNGSFTNGIDIGATASIPVGGSCFGAIEGDVWYSVLVNNVSADLVISTDFDGGTHTDTEIAIYRGSDCDNLTFEMGCGQDIDDSNYLSKVVIPAEDLIVGETLYILVDRYNEYTPSGTFCIEAYYSGCTDPVALNYQPSAIEDNGSCLYTPLIFGEGDIYLENNIASGIVLKSPDSKCWRTTVDNNGILITVSVPCP